MEYSKDIVLNSNYNEVNKLKDTIKRTSKLKEKLKDSKILKFIVVISVMCATLMFVDIILIYSFANTLQSML